MNDDKRKPDETKDKAVPSQQDATDVSWRGRTPTSRSDDEHSDYALGETNDAHDDEGEEVRDTKADPKLEGTGSDEEAETSLLGEGQERAAPEASDDEEVRQSS